MAEKQYRIHSCISRGIFDNFRQANLGVDLYTSQLKRKLRMLQNSGVSMCMHSKIIYELYK